MAAYFPGETVCVEVKRPDGALLGRYVLSGAVISVATLFAHDAGEWIEVAFADPETGERVAVNLSKADARDIARHIVGEVEE
jgi:hypothetical protein